MLLDSHNLYGVISILYDAWQYIILELSISSHLLGILCHSDVAFIDEQWAGIGLKPFTMPLVRLFRVPHLRGEYFCLVVLDHTLTPCGDSLPFPTVPMNVHLIQIAMMHPFL